MALKQQTLSTEKVLEQSLVPKDEQPYKVPGNWAWVKLGNTVKVKRGASPRPIKAYVTENQNGVNWIKIGDTGEGKYVYSVKEKITKEGANKSVYVEQGTLLLSNSMSFGRPYILKIDGCIHDGWLAITVTDCFYKEYIYYALLASDWYFDQVAVGTAVRNLNSERVAGLPTPLPPLAEQQRIVDRIEGLFEKLNKAKELIQEILDTFDNRKAAILHQAFTGELTKKWREENGEGMDSWESIELKDILLPMQVKKPLGTTFRYIDIDSIDNKKQKVKKPKEMLVREAPSRASRGLENGDVLFSMVRPYLKNIAFIDTTLNDCIASTGFYVCRCNHKISPTFLYYLLCSKDTIDYLMQFMKGDNSPSIRTDDLLYMNVFLPQLDEQNIIVSILESLLDKEQLSEEIAEDVIKQIDLMKKAILARAFRGELGTNDPTEESALELLKEILAE